MAKSLMTIMFMYDNGKTNTIRLRSLFYKLFCIASFMLPVLLGLSLTACYYLWEDNTALNTKTLHLQIEMTKAKALAENLSTFKKFLSEDHSINASAVLMNQAEEVAETMEQQNKVEAMQEQEGPGHVEFPAVDTKEVVVENISARILDEDKLRISLDLRNPNPQVVVYGHVNCTFVDSNGLKHDLNIPKDLMNFRINRFKRVVFLPSISAETLGENGNILIEVYDNENKIMYRNIAPIEQ